MHDSAWKGKDHEPWAGKQRYSILLKLRPWNKHNKIK